MERTAAHQFVCSIRFGARSWGVIWRRMGRSVDRIHIRHQLGISNFGGEKPSGPLWEQIQQQLVVICPRSRAQITCECIISA